MIFLSLHLNKLETTDDCTIRLSWGRVNDYVQPNVLIRPLGLTLSTYIELGIWFSDSEMIH